MAAVALATTAAANAAAASQRRLHQAMGHQAAASARTGLHQNTIRRDAGFPASGTFNSASGAFKLRRRLWHRANPRVLQNEKANTFNSASHSAHTRSTFALAHRYGIWRIRARARDRHKFCNMTTKTQKRGTAGEGMPGRKVAAGGSAEALALEPASHGRHLHLECENKGGRGLGQKNDPPGFIASSEHKDCATEFIACAPTRDKILL